MAILNDKELTELQEKHGIITPFVKKQVGKGVISYGLSSFGYDVSLSPKQFTYFEHRTSSFINPKNFAADRVLSRGILRSSEWGKYYILPPHTTGLGVSIERFSIPNNVVGVAVGKSTYARCGINVLVTPLEPGWEGYLTIEITNTTAMNAAIYVNEGILQVMFHKGKVCKTDYSKRKGKYQNQLERVTYPTIKK